MMNSKQIIDELKKLSAESARETWRKMGMDTTNLLGVELTKLKALAKKVGRNHELAVELWNTGIHDARILAALIEEPKKFSPEQAEAWIGESDFWDLSDQLCIQTVAKTDFAEEKMKEHRILEGFALWNPVTGRVEFHAYNFEADFLFKGEYTLLEKDKLQRTYEVYYPNDHEHAKRGYPVIKFRETYTLRDPDTIDLNIIYYNKKDNRWDLWGDSGNFVMVRRKSK